MLPERAARWPGPTGRWLAPVGVGVATGAMGGMAAFVLSRVALAPGPVDALAAGVLVALAGAYTHLLLLDLRASVTAMLVALGIGTATVVAAWVAPLWVLPYAPLARAVLLPPLLQRAVTAAMTTWLPLFLVGHLTTMVADGVVR